MERIHGIEAPVVGWRCSRASLQVTPTPHTTNAPPVRGKQKARPREILGSRNALVPVVFVLVVQVAIVDVVDVVAVLDSNVAAALAVLVIVALVNDVCHGGVLSFHGSIALLLLKKMMLLFRFESENS